MATVTAQVILKSPTGESIVDSKTPPTAEEMQRLRPDAAAIERAARLLERRGFKVEDENASGLTISGDVATYEQVFNIKPAPAGSMQPKQTCRFDAELEPLIADVVFTMQPEFF